MAATIKTIGSSGQIALGKQYAGKHVLVDEMEPGVWMIKVGEFIPENERWLANPEAQKDLDEGLAWAARTPPSETNLKQLERDLLGERTGTARSE